MTGIIIEVVGEVKPERRDVECLFQEFGYGVHVIERKDSGECELMVIANRFIDVIFIAESGMMICIKNDDGKLPFLDFYTHYRYIKKLDFGVDEIMVKVHLEGGKGK